MAAIIFVAIIVDRRALSLRNVAVAAVIILLTTPEAIFHAGFQMSFAAVTALITGYEWASRHADPYRSFTWPARLKRYAIGLAATDLIAAIATAPYALYHFNRVAIYSLTCQCRGDAADGFLDYASGGRGAYCWRRLGSTVGLGACRQWAWTVCSPSPVRFQDGQGLFQLQRNGRSQRCWR